MNAGEILLPLLLVSLLSLFIFYFIIKSAVTAGIIAAWNKKDEQEHNLRNANSSAQEIDWTPERRALYARYEKGELTTQQYHDEWNKLG